MKNATTTQQANPEPAMNIEATIQTDLADITFDLVIEAGRVIEVDGARAEDGDGFTCTLNHTAACSLYDEHMTAVNDAIDWDGIAAGLYR